MTRASSLDNIKDWVDEISGTTNDHLGFILVGTKYDLWLEGFGEPVEQDRVEQVISGLHGTALSQSNHHTLQVTAEIIQHATSLSNSRFACVGCCLNHSPLGCH